MNYYKRLGEVELESLKDDFVSFLVVNGITGYDWDKMQTAEPERAGEIIDQFSDVIYESSLRKAQFLLMVDNHHLRSFQCATEKITLVSLDYIGSDEFSFHDVEDLQTLLSNPNQDFKIASINKGYNKKREHEMFDMIRSGCKISEGKAFKLLALYWAELKASQN